MQSSVHVRIRHAAKELGVIFSQDIAIFGWIFFKRRRIGLKSVVFGPLLLILLLNRNQGVALLGLCSSLTSVSLLVLLGRGCFYILELQGRLGGIGGIEGVRHSRREERILLWTRLELEDADVSE